MEPPHIIESNNLAIRAAAAVCRDHRVYTPTREARREPPEPPQRINSRLTLDKVDKPSPPQTLSSGSLKSQFSNPPTPPTLYPSNPQTPLTPPTPQGPGPGSGEGDSPNILGTSLEDEFTRVSCLEFSFCCNCYSDTHDVKCIPHHFPVPVGMHEHSFVCISYYFCMYYFNIIAFIIVPCLK